MFASFAATAVQAQEQCSRLFTDSPQALFLGVSHEDAGSARLHFIRNETQEIRASYYQFDGNKIGKLAVAELIRAVKKGVKVRLLLDAWNPESWVDERISPELYQVMIKNGVQVRIFNQIDPDGYSKYLHPKNYVRMHDKLLILSSQQVVTTGDRNVQNSYFGPFQHKKGMKGKSTTSFEILVRGDELTRASEAYFDQMWDSATAPDFNPKTLSASKIYVIENNLPTFEKIADEAYERGINWTRRLNENEVKDIDFVHDQPGLKAVTKGTAESILEEIQSAKKSVVIYAPYTFFSARFLSALNSAMSRGVKITLVLPSWNSIDTPITLQHFEKQAAGLRKKGMEILQHEGDDFMHGKMMIVDQKSVYVGSYNFNKRSELNDYESGVIVKDKEFAEQVIKFDENFRNQVTDFKESKKTRFDSIKVSLLRFFAAIVPFLGKQL